MKYHLPAWIVIILLGAMLASGCAAHRAVPERTPDATSISGEDLATLKDRITQEFGTRIPQQWGEAVTGVLTRLDTDQNVLALTFDACGGKYGSGCDAALISYLEREQIPATLFINARWIAANPDAFLELAHTRLFEIENHGLTHKPCSVTGRSAYGIQGTASAADLVDEIEINARKIASLTGRKPLFYRPGTAYCDEVGVQVAQSLGYGVAGFTTLGDAGATYTREQVKNALLSAPRGAIVILHMNHPAGQTCAGVMDAIPELKRRGVRFVTLSEYPLL